jgi:hypothetical protein
MASVWKIIEPDPARQKELAAQLSEERKTWVIRHAAPTRAEVEAEVRKALAELTRAQRRALAMRLREERLAEGLAKRDGDPATRLGQPLGRNERPREPYAGVIDVDWGGEVRPLGHRDEAVDRVDKARRVSFGDVFAQPAWNGTRYEK